MQVKLNLNKNQVRILADLLMYEEIKLHELSHNKYIDNKKIEKAISDVKYIQEYVYSYLDK